MYPVYTATEAGIITGKGMAVPWDSESYDLTIERITRGLFFHHFGTIIGVNAEIKPIGLKLPTGFKDKMYTVSIANGQFSYHYNKTDESDYDSAWFFNSYHGHFAGSLVLSGAIKERILSDH